jgi:cytochrome c556
MPEQWSRRWLLKNLLGAAAAGMVSQPLQGLWLPQGGQLTGMERGEMGRLAAEFNFLSLSHAMDSLFSTRDSGSTRGSTRVAPRIWGRQTCPACSGLRR